MEEKDTVHALSRLPDKLAFILSVSKCVIIPLGVYLCFSSFLTEDNFLVTNSIVCMKCLIVVNFLAWLALTTFVWMRAPTTASSKKSRIRFGHLFKCLVSMGLLACCLHVFIVLFGAALTVEVSETFHLATLSACLALWPCIFHYGLQWDHWITSIFVFEGSPFTGIEGSLSLGAKGALIGLWLGAIPIPLDWDRPWQQWPTTCVVGTLLGHVAGLTCHVFATLKTLRKDSKRNKIV